MPRSISPRTTYELVTRLVRAHRSWMAYRVSSSSLEAAIRHLCRYGDTDIFPHLPELAFLADEQEAVIAKLTKLDHYTPAGAFEALAPNSRYSF